MMGPIPVPVDIRFWRYVVKTNDCWYWSGQRNNRGYGRIKDLGKQKRAHRTSWEIHHGQISDGLEVCHKCDNPSCVNPDHLFLGTHKDNMQDAFRKGRLKQVFTVKLTPDDVRFIRQNYVRGSGKILAAQFGVRGNTVTRIARGETRKEVT